MHEHVTVMHAEGREPTARGVSSGLRSCRFPRLSMRLVLSCLAKDPAHRPQSARELSLRLAAVDGASAWTQERAREWWATHQPAPR